MLVKRRGEGLMLTLSLAVACVVLRGVAQRMAYAREKLPCAKNCHAQKRENQKISNGN